jgi:AraC family transcriptional regulator
MECSSALQSDDAWTAPDGAVQAAQIDNLLRGSRLAGPSSLSLDWDGLILEPRVSPPLERAETRIDHHYVLLWRGAPIITEREYVSGRFMRLVKPPGSLSLGLAGRLPAVRPGSAFDVVACVLDPAVVDRVCEEADRAAGVTLQEHVAFTDPEFASLVELAAAECAAGGLHGKLYRDSLTYAIMARFNRLARTEVVDKPTGSPLPKHRLARVLDKIRSDYDRDLSLAELAAESGYSRAHFLRMFSAATGRSPHRYLQEVRLERARERLRAKAASITDVAHSCGFSSHAHLTRLFHRRYGLTPSAYRSAAVSG